MSDQQLSLRRCNRATLARQLLLERTHLDPPEAVRHLVALQAQQPAAPYVALWNRLHDLDAGAIDAAIDARTLVKATLFRMTLHLVHVDDHAAVRSAMQPTLRSRHGDARFTVTGLTVADTDALLDDLLTFTATPRANADLEAWLADRTGADGRAVWWGLKASAPVWHTPSDDSWRFGDRPAFTAARTATPYAGSEVADADLGALTLRYLASYGPATIADVARFALVQRGRVRTALAGVEDHVVRLRGPDGRELLDVPDAPLPDEDVPAPPRLLGMWDNVLLAHADRTRLLPPDVRKLVIRANGDVLPTLLVDGQVAGVWRALDGHIEATAFVPIPDDAWDGLEAEAAALGAWLAPRDPRPFRRYDHWWAKLPVGTVRSLPTS